MKFHGYQILEQEVGFEGLQVFRAVEDGGDRQVQIRAFPTALSRFPLLLEQLQTTYKKLSRIQHKGILPIQSLKSNAGQPFVVFPYVDAGSLADRFRSGFYSALDVSQIVNEIAETIDYAHRKGLIHGNITPEHVLFDEEGSVHLVGFGEAAILKALPSSEVQDIERFGPPEMEKGSKLSPATDQFSLALIALRLFSGLPAENAVEALKSDIVKIRRHNGREKRLSLDLSSQVLEVLLRALAQKPSHRYASILEFNQALQVALGVVKQPRHASAKQHEQVVEEQKPERKKRALVLATFLTAIVVFGIAISVVVAQWIGSDRPGETAENIIAATPGGIELPDERPTDSDLSENSALVRDSTPLDSTGADGTGGNEIMTPTPTVGDSGGQVQPTSQPAPTKTQPPRQNPTNPPLDTETPTPAQTETPAISETPGPSATPTPTNPSPTDTPLPTSTATVPPPTSTSTPPPQPTIDPNDCNYKKKKKPNYCTPSP